MPQESLRLQPRLPRRLPPSRARCRSSLGSGPCPAQTPPLPTTLLPADWHMRPWPGASVNTVKAEPSLGQVPAECLGFPSMGVGGADALSPGSFPRVLGEQLSSPSGQKQPKVQKLEQLCRGLEQVCTQVSPHSRYTWLAGHWPTAAGPCGPRERGRAPRAWPPTRPWPRTQASPSSTWVFSVSQTRGDWGHRVWGPGPPPDPPQDSQQRPGPRQLLTGWPAILHWREYSDSVAQLQWCRPGWAHVAMSAWQLSRKGSLGTLHSRDTRVSNWMQVWAWAQGHSGS